MCRLSNRKLRHSRFPSGQAEVVQFYQHFQFHSSVFSLSLFLPMRPSHPSSSWIIAKLTFLRFLKRMNKSPTILDSFTSSEMFIYQWMPFYRPCCESTIKFSLKNQFSSSHNLMRESDTWFAFFTHWKLIIKTSKIHSLYHLSLEAIPFPHVLLAHLEQEWSCSYDSIL